MTRDELIRQAAHLLELARQPGEPLPLGALIDHLIAPQPRPEGVSEKDHLAAEHDRARELGSLLFSEHVRVFREGNARWDAWENAPGGLIEKLSRFEATQTGLTDWQLEEAIGGRR